VERDDIWRVDHPVGSKIRLQVMRASSDAQGGERNCEINPMNQRAKTRLGNLRRAQRCGAKTRAGGRANARRCVCGRERCRIHGGL